MHRYLIKEATDEQIRSFAMDALTMLKETNPETYETLELHLYKEIYGCHFNSWMLECAVEKLENEDGTTGAHWTVEQTNQVVKSVGGSFYDYNEFDWNYVMNMLYSDYYGLGNADATFYGKMAKKFLEDKDAPEGKALKYYLAMKK